MRALGTTLSFLLALLAAGCEHRPTAAPADPLADLLLDGGRRWRSDDHTRRVLGQMGDTLQAAKAESDAAVVGRRMQAHIDELVAGCTMQGPAHDALHVYLAALLPRVQAMGSSDRAAARRAWAEVEAIVRRFLDYFE